MISPGGGPAGLPNRVNPSNESTVRQHGSVSRAPDLRRAMAVESSGCRGDWPGDIIATPGSLEDAIGEMALAQRSNGRFTSTRQLVKAHLRGDGAASAVWLRSVRALAAGVVSLINAVDPEIFIIGGGIAQA